MEDVFRAANRASRRMFSVSSSRADSAGNTSDDYRQEFLLKAIQCQQIGLNSARTKVAIRHRTVDMIRGVSRANRVITGVDSISVSRTSSPEEQYSAKEQVRLLMERLTSDDFALLLATCMTGNICEVCIANFGEYKTSYYNKITKIIQKARKILECY